MNNFNLDSIPQIPFCCFPTPISYLKRLSEYLEGPNVYIKRDDLTGIAFGGNKNRKLEYLLADAVNTNADVIITEGAVQSNHCLQTAACSNKIGLECELVLSGEQPEIITGNLLLDHILDTKTHIIADGSMRKAKMREIAENLRNEGKIPYIIPTGGSTKIGALGYMNCIQEIKNQSKDLSINFSHFVHPTGSGGTQAGILLGVKVYYPEMKVIGISVGMGDIEGEIKTIIKNFLSEWSLDLEITDSEIVVLKNYYGKGYGIPSKEMVEAVKLVAKLEGIFLDPVYNGKAMAGLIDLIKKKDFPKDSNILFLHSGGGPALFNYNKSFIKS